LRVAESKPLDDHAIVCLLDARTQDGVAPVSDRHPEASEAPEVGAQQPCPLRRVIKLDAVGPRYVASGERISLHE